VPRNEFLSTAMWTNKKSFQQACLIDLFRGTRCYVCGTRGNAGGKWKNVRQKTWTRGCNPLFGKIL